MWFPAVLRLTHLLISVGVFYPCFPSCVHECDTNMRKYTDSMGFKVGKVGLEPGFPFLCDVALGFTTLTLILFLWVERINISRERVVVNKYQGRECHVDSKIPFMLLTTLKIYQSISLTKEVFTVFSKLVHWRCCVSKSQWHLPLGAQQPPLFSLQKWCRSCKEGRTSKFKLVFSLHSALDTCQTLCGCHCTETSLCDR